MSHPTPSARLPGCVPPHVVESKKMSKSRFGVARRAPYFKRSGMPGSWMDGCGWTADTHPMHLMNFFPPTLSVRFLFARQRAIILGSLYGWTDGRTDAHSNSNQKNSIRKKSQRQPCSTSAHTRAAASATRRQMVSRYKKQAKKAHPDCAPRRLSSERSAGAEILHDRRPFQECRQNGCRQHGDKHVPRARLGETNLIFFTHFMNDSIGLNDITG